MDDKKSVVAEEKEETVTEENQELEKEEDILDLSYDEKDLDNIDEWNEKKDENEEEIYKIQVRLSEIDSLKFEYENTWETENPSMSGEEYEALLLEEKDLYRRLKEINKKKKKTNVDNTPLWMIIYAVVQAVISSPVMIFIQIDLLNKVATWEWLNKVFATLSDFWGNFFLYTLLFIFPVINVLITLIIYLIIKKDKPSKKVFRYILFGHIGLMLISAIIAILIMFV